MIPESLRWKLAAGLAGLAVTGAVVTLAFPSDPVEMAGGGAPMASLGSSFADLAAGSPEATEPSETTAPDPVTPTETTQTTETAAQPTPEASETTPTEATETQQTTADAAESPQPEVTAAVPTTAMPTVPTAAEPAAPQPAEAATPAAAVAAESPEVTERVTGAAPDETAVRTSPRPPSRTPEFEAANRPAPEPQPTRSTQAPSRGNADQNARAGAATGQEQAPRSTAGGGRGQSQAAGNAAASNYPGEVMRRLSRVRRPNVRTNGTARVTFTIAGSGGLAAARVTSTSGSRSLDAAAVRLVQRAAPFPAPPAGAQRQFSISISGR